MYPIICDIGPIHIYSYGLMLAIAVMVCAFLMSRDASKMGIDSQVIFDAIFWVILIGLMGARLFYIVLNWSFFAENPLEMIMIQRGGLAWQGSLVFGLGTGIIFLKRKKLPLLPILDLAAPYIALGQAIGRVGCFLNGCCYGKATVHGIYFPVHDARLHPTQLYCSLGLFFIFFLLKYYRRISKIPGEVFIAYLILASVLRFFVEFWRADHYRTFLSLSVYQWVSLTVLILALGVWRCRRRTP